MSDLSTMIKRFILPVIFASVAFQIPVQANTVRILGPAADEQPATFVEPSLNDASNRSSVASYGPTKNNETLWSIASRYRPNSQVSVYQVIGAIHRANTQAFEQNNIHGLIPGSTLVMPSLAQIRQENIDSVKRRLAADQRRQSRQASTPTLPSAPAPKAKPVPTVVAEPLPKPEVAKEEVLTQTVPKPSSDITQPAVAESTKGGIPVKPVALQAQLDASDVQMTKLLESNHLLRVRLSEVRHEVTALKDQISSDEVLRAQIKDFIQQQKAQQVQPVVSEASWLDSLVSNPWALAAVALIPGSLIAGALAFFMLRRKKEGEDEVKSLQGPEAQEPAMVPPPANSDDGGIPELPGDEDKDIDDLFGGDEESLFDDPEKSLFAAEADSVDMLDLSSESNDEFEIDSGLAASSISVKGDEQAIGLQDMERALDEMDQGTEPSADEALAAMWEQSLQAEADDEDSFDLSDDSLGDDLLADQEIEDGLLDQSILDDLLSEVESEQLEQENQTQAEKEEISPQVVDQDELDSLFDSVGMADTVESPVDTVSVDEADDTAQQAAIDQALAEADAMFAAESEAVAEGDIDALFDENSVALLDELIEEDELSSDIEVEENSTALLDELLDDPDAEQSLLNPAISIDENSTALLDELVDEISSDTAGIEDYASEAAAVEAKETLNLDDVVIDENSTELLDDILAQHGSHSEVSAPDALDSNVGATATEPEAFAADFSDPEFEPVTAEEAVTASPAQVQSELEPDADFSDLENSADNSAFEDIFNGALEEQSREADVEPALSAEQVLDPEFDADPLENELSQSEELTGTTEIDALLADVDGLLDEPETDDVESLERSVDELLETFEHQPDESQAQEPAVDEDLAVQDTALQPEQPVQGESAIDAVDDYDTGTSVEEALEETVLSGASSGISSEFSDDDFPTFGEEIAITEPEPLSDLPPEPLPELQSEPEPEPIAAEEAVSLSLDDLPEFDEEAAFNDPEAEMLEEMFSPASEDEEQVALDNIVQQLQQAAEAAQPEVTLEEPEPLPMDESEPLSLDELPEFDEEAAFNDPEAEMLEEMFSPVSEDEEQVALDNIAQQLQQAAEAAQPEVTLEEPDSLPEFQSEPESEPLAMTEPGPLSLDDLPEFDEEAAFNDPEAEMLEEMFSPVSEDEEQVALDNIVQQLQQAAEAAQPEVTLEEPEPEPELLAMAESEPLSLDDLPEFDEEAAFNDPEAEMLEEVFSSVSEDEEQVALDNIVKQLQQAAEAAQPEVESEAALSFGEPLDSEMMEPAVTAQADLAAPQASIHGQQQVEFETIDPDSLPEFSENEALQASFEEQHELEQYELEQGLNEPQAPQTPQAEAQLPADMFDDELVDSAGLDMAALLSDPEGTLDHFDTATVDSVIEPPVDPEVPEVEHIAVDGAAEPEAELDVEPFYADEAVHAQPEVIADQAPASIQPAAEEVAFDEVANTATSTSFDIQDELEAEREQLLAGSFDERFDADDHLDGLSDSELEMPEEDSEIWAATSPEPILETEDWADQPQMQIEDVAAFDTEMLLAEAESQALLQAVAGSELVDEPVTSPSYISIDELMKEMEPENPVELDDAPLNLDVGLDEFPDVLSDVAAFDVDSQGEYASKLDLAKAYLEMNDSEGALGLLEEVANNGDAQIKREAKELLGKVRG